MLRNENISKNEKSQVEQKIQNGLNGSSANDQSLELLIPKSTQQKPTDPLQYVMGELIKQVKGILLPSPEDPTYQFARKIAGACIENSDGKVNELLSDGLSIGVYKMLEEITGYVRKKKL